MGEDHLPILENEQSPTLRRTAEDNELDPPDSGGCCNPASGFHRFLALIFMCLLGFGKSLFFRDLMGIKEKDKPKCANHS